jgi:hypothetical protein
MFKYTRVGTRFCVLFTLVMAASFLARPLKAADLACASACQTQFRLCFAQCNSFPGGDSCLMDCSDQRVECLAAC